VRGGKDGAIQRRGNASIGAAGLAFRPTLPSPLSGEGVSIAISIHSHSMVPGGFEVMSKTTRFTPLTSFVIRFEIFASTS
jgi:hypothetical protein